METMQRWGIVGALYLAANPAKCQEVAPPTQAPDCPVTFENVTAIDSTPQLSGRLVAPGLQSIRLLAPRSSGLFVVRADSGGDAPVYGSYSVAEQPAAQEYALRLGLGGVDWSPASETPGELESEINSGWYRVVIRYLAPSVAGPRNARICFGVSPAFSLTGRFSFHRLE
jgi:hypothetical protein